MVWAVLVVGIFLMVLLGAYFSYRIAFYVPKVRKEDIFNIPEDDQYGKRRPVMVSLIREMDALPYEQVYIRSLDGKKLAARYYHVRDSAPLQIQFHGYRGTALRDFCGGNKLARKKGHNTLVIDQRAHGKSEGNTITFGIRERYDCLQWIRYAVDRFGEDTPILLAGVSMGAATVLMASGLDLPENVVGIFADCPYSSAGAIIRKVCRDMKLAPFFVYPFLLLGAFLFGGIRLSQGNVVKAVQKAKVPIRIFHGEDDRFVPCEMSKEIIDACTSTNKKRVTFPEAGHGLSYMVDPERYEKEFEEFLVQCGMESQSSM